MEVHIIDLRKDNFRHFAEMLFQADGHQEVHDIQEAADPKTRGS